MKLRADLREDSPDIYREIITIVTLLLLSVQQQGKDAKFRHSVRERANHQTTISHAAEQIANCAPTTDR